MEELSFYLITVSKLKYRFFLIRRDEIGRTIFYRITVS